MNTRIELLSDQAIDTVSGGLTCRDAQTVSDAYGAVSQMFSNAGMDVQAVAYAGIAHGVLIGGCSPSGK
jgi:hypothetical protein